MTLAFGLVMSVVVQVFPLPEISTVNGGRPQGANGRRLLPGTLPVTGHGGPG